MSQAATLPLPKFGAVADDVTGATDLANTLVRGGLATALAIGVPDDGTDAGGAAAVVVALKTRTIAAAAAVAQSLAAQSWLLAGGVPASAIMVKYCSTFDSTARGNIGPVVDAMLAAAGLPLAIVCPAFPANGRTVYQGRLFVGALPLDESGMRDHPLTPMRDASLARLLAAQTDGRVDVIPWPTVAAGAEALGRALAAAGAQGVRHAVVDAIRDEDLVTIARAAWGRAMLTGGSGIAIGVPNLCGAAADADAATAGFPVIRGASLILAGSCSAATNAQVAAFEAAGGRTLHLDPVALAAGPAALAAAEGWLRAELGPTPILLASTAAPEALLAVQARLGVEAAAALVEDALGRLAVSAVAAGARRLVVAGGETSGAVMQALGVRLLRIGPEIAPGVPWTASQGKPSLALALKSGNFGGPDFFQRAFATLP